MHYEFRESDAWDFARSQGIRIFEKGQELQFEVCPYCRGGRKPDKQTFAINRQTGQFHCCRASCGQQGSFFRLAKDFDIKLSDDFSKYYERRKTFRKLPRPQHKPIPTEPVIEYFKNRGISEQTVREYQITSDKNNPDTICFPIYNTEGDLVNVKFRDSKHTKESKGPKEWFMRGCEMYIYGVNTWDGQYDRFILTEGQIDALSCFEAGFTNCFSVPGGKNSFTWWPAAYDFLSKFQECVIFGDFEHGSVTLLNDMKQRFPNKISCVQIADYKDCKDANEILQKYGTDGILNCIGNAKPEMMKQVAELADVENVDIYSIQKLPTGIRQLDRMLYGGIPFGGVSIVSGKAGEGKSTLASQILVNALNNNMKCFAYSGELPNFLFKAWMDFQIAGKSHIVTFIDQFDNIVPNLSKTNRAAISEWYRDKMYIYDNSSVTGEETESLIQLVDKTIRQYGIQVILIDNLMTAMDFSSTAGNDIYDKQTTFVNSLRRIAMKYNVCIILVAHKRKNNMSTNVNDEIAGSSNILNMAMVNIAYEKSNDLNDNQRLLRLAKNRLFGKTYTKGWVTEYEPLSKRIYAEGDNPYIEYNWDHGEEQVNDYQEYDKENPFLQVQQNSAV